MATNECEKCGEPLRWGGGLCNGCEDARSDRYAATWQGWMIQELQAGCDVNGNPRARTVAYSPKGTMRAYWVNERGEELEGYASSNLPRGLVRLPQWGVNPAEIRRLDDIAGRQRLNPSTWYTLSGWREGFSIWAAGTKAKASKGRREIIVGANEWTDIKTGADLIAEARTRIGVAWGSSAYAGHDILAEIAEPFHHWAATGEITPDLGTRWMEDGWLDAFFTAFGPCPAPRHWEPFTLTMPGQATINL